MDIFHKYSVVKIVTFVWRDENKRKRGREWPILFLKRNEKGHFLTFYFSIRLEREKQELRDYMEKDKKAMREKMSEEEEDRKRKEEEMKRKLREQQEQSENEIISLYKVILLSVCYTQTWGLCYR